MRRKHCVVADKRERMQRRIRPKRIGDGYDTVSDTAVYVEDLQCLVCTDGFCEHCGVGKAEFDAYQIEARQRCVCR